jgi:hypothetical protein
LDAQATQHEVLLVEKGRWGALNIEAETRSPALKTSW